MTFVEFLRISDFEKLAKYNYFSENIGRILMLNSWNNRLRDSCASGYLENISPIQALTLELRAYISLVGM